MSVCYKVLPATTYNKVKDPNLPIVLGRTILSILTNDL